MRTRLLPLLVALGLLVATAGSALAVNCAQVRRYLSTGRSVQDVADTMILSVDEVKKCQQEDSKAEQKAGQKAADKPATAPAPVKKK